MSEQVNTAVLLSAVTIACAALAWVPAIWSNPQSWPLIRAPLICASLSSLLQLTFINLVEIGAIPLAYSLRFCAIGIPCSVLAIGWAISNARKILWSVGILISSLLTIAMWLFLAMLH